VNIKAIANTSAGITGKKNRLSSSLIEIKKNKWIYIMVLPVLAYYIIFCYGPMYGAIIAFKNFDISKGIWGSDWVGAKHFVDFFNNVHFSRLLKNTFLISFYQIFWGFPAPIIFALLLNEIRHNKFKRVVQTATYLPHFVSMVVICGLIQSFVGRDGIITDILVSFGMERTNMLLKPEYFRTIYVSSEIWQQVGWSSIIYLSALSGIDQQLYEAATVDGAGRFKQALHVTLPGILPTVITMLILRLGQVMSVGFEKIILLYSPITYETADVISSFVYRKGLGESFQYSFTTAVGLFTSLINLLLVVISNKMSKKISGTGLW
jgi:putative aldouronate transport system permease protein